MSTDTTNASLLGWTAVEAAIMNNTPAQDLYLDVGAGAVVVVRHDDPGADATRAAHLREPARYLRLEPVPPREQYRWMEHFAASVPEPELRRALLLAMDGRGAFRRFKRLLSTNPAEHERWRGARQSLVRRYIRQWFDRLPPPRPAPPPWSVGDEAPPPAGEAPARLSDELRQAAYRLIERIPALELPAAIAYLCFLRDRAQDEE